MRTKERIHTIDLLRGIAIFLVVFGHITHNQTLRTYIWGFHGAPDKPCGVLCRC